MNWHRQLCLYHRGQIHFHLGLLPNRKTEAHAGFFCSCGLFLTILPRCPEEHTQSRAEGDAEHSKHWEKQSASKLEQEVPHSVCSALTVLGEVQEGEVNIVRRGGASLGGQPSHASHWQDPAQLSLSRMLGPCRHLKKPRSRACPSCPQHHHLLRGLN